MDTPRIIAGPILRRVDKRNVSVWLACSKNYHCTLKLYEGDGVEAGSTNAITTEGGEGPTIQFGKNLWVVVLTAVIPTPGLAPDNIYSYNVLLESMDTPGDAGDLKSEGLLSDDDHLGRPQLALGYAKDKLPTFVLPSDDPAKLFIGQASCRKMHGAGADALAYFDAVIKDNITKPELRPQQLFLTGDQIYADDVAAAHLRYSGNLDGTALVGTEKVGIRMNNGTLEELPADSVTMPPFLRQHLVNEHAGFTSDAADCHLVSFEEYAATYLNYWSIRSWNLSFYEKLKPLVSDNKKPLIKALATELLTGSALPDDPSFLANIQAAKTREAQSYLFTEELNKVLEDGPSGKKFKTWQAGLQASLEHQLENMVAFVKDLPKVSRVLANVPCYMIFDDHEITDDWNLTQRWKNQVLSKPLGRDIIRNGLMAYAVFQDWGNMPEEYVPIEQEGENDAQLKPRTRFIRLVQEYCWRIANETPAQLATLRTEVLEPMERMLGLGSEPASVKWHYQVPTGITQTCVLNTRTCREYPSLNAPPILISEADLDEQLPSGLAEQDLPFVVVISPVPVLGLASFEELIQPAAASVVGLTSTTGRNRGILAGEISFDFEAWGFNVTGFERLLERLSKYKKVVLLSGDVHYGASAVLDYWEGDGATPAARILQLTSSSSKNAWMENLAFFKSAMIQRIFTGIGGNLEKLGWRNRVLSPSGSVSIRNRQRLRQSTAVVPVAGWVPGASVNMPADFRWRLRFATDETVRTGDPITSDISLADEAAQKDAYTRVAERHQQYFVSGVSRRLVWPANVSRISFEPDGESWNVKHAFLFEQGARTEAEKKVGPHIQHAISLVASGAAVARPELV